MTTRILIFLCVLFVLVACSKENIDQVNEVNLHKPTIVTDKDAAVTFKSKDESVESAFEASYCTIHEDFYFITPQVPCITVENGSFSISTSGDGEYALFLSKSNGEFGFINSFMIEKEADAPHISSRWDPSREISCISQEPKLEIYDETNDYITGKLEAEFFKTVGDVEPAGPDDFCTRTESIGLMTIEFIAIKTESECE